MSDTQDKRAFKLKVWQIILVPIILALIPLIYPEIKALFMRKQPQFVIENPIINKGDSILRIFAENAPARKREALNVEVEGLEFRDAGELVKDEPPLEWEFNFTQYGIPEVLFAEGINTIRIGFPSSVGYDELKVYVRADFYQSIANSTPQELVIKSNSDLQEVVNQKRKVEIVSNVMDDDSRVGIAESALRGKDMQAYGLPDRTHFKDVEFTEVRFFAPEDEADAKEIAETLKNDLNINAKTKNLSRKIPKVKSEQLKGNIEVVLAKE
ncbi:MAG: hypothetical protein AAF849_01245 [Bacteroidota bacterium]